MVLHNVWLLCMTTFQLAIVLSADEYNVLRRDGSYEFGYDAPDSFHHSQANRNNVVRGEFGGRSPETGAIDTVQYTAGPRGFRPRGKNIVRKYDLSQAGPRPVGSRDDPYYDPSEDPSYSFNFKTRTYSRQEAANRVGDVAGKYTYLDDVGERHNVEFIAGKNTGFHVKTPFPDSNPRAYGPLYFNGRGKPIPRGRTSIQRGLDGSYRFISAGPDQRRTEVSDSTGHVRGSYTYLDDKGVQHSVHYIAGPETGYRVLKNVKGPHLPTVYPFGRPEIIPADFYDYLAPGGPDDLFDTAASGHVKPSKPPRPSYDFNEDNGGDISGGDSGKDDFSSGGSGGGSRPGGGSSYGGGSDRKPSGGGTTPSFGSSTSRPFGGGGRPRPSYDDEEGDFDVFGGSGGSSSTTYRPGGSYVPPTPTATARGFDDGSYKPTGDDGSYRSTASTSGSDGSFDRTTGRPSYGDDFGLFDGTTSRTGGRPSSRPFGRTTVRPSTSGPSDYGLSGSGPSGGGSSGLKPSTSQIGISHGDGAGHDSKGTIVTNVGDRLFSVPPGVSVRAHVQAIDLLPLSQRSPSPTEQLKAEMRDELAAENSDVNEDVQKSHSNKDSNEVETDATTIAAITTTDNFLL